MIKVGTTQISDMYIGEVQVKRVYKGNLLIWTKS